MNRDKTFFGHARRGYHHGSLKDALLEAARSLVAEHGPSGFTLTEAAKLVGVTAGAPYRHFADRNALMGELARRGFELFGERLVRAWDEGRPDARQALARMGLAYIAFARAEPGLYAAMFVNGKAAAGSLSEVAAIHSLETLQRATGAVLARFGAAAPSEARKLAYQLWSLSHGVAMLTLAGHFDRAHGADPAAIMESAANALLEAAIRRVRER